jgi:hypothetical protein
VFFDTAGLATDVVLDGGPGRLYYRRPVKDQVGTTQEKEPTPDAAADEASEPVATPGAARPTEGGSIHPRLRHHSPPSPQPAPPAKRRPSGPPKVTDRRPTDELLDGETASLQALAPPWMELAFPPIADARDKAYLAKLLRGSPSTGW